MTAARLRAWRGWRAAAGPFTRFVHPAPFVDLALPGDTPDARATPSARPPSGRAAAVARTLRSLPVTTAAFLDLPLATGLDVVRAASTPTPWVVLVVPRLDLPATTHPVGGILAAAPGAPVPDPDWWREPDPAPAPRAAWFVLDGDRDAPLAPARARRTINARHAVDADQLPPPAALRRAGYDAVAIVGRRAAPAPDLADFVEACLDEALRVSCLGA